jgi:Lrp/AsnC family transcriptional regulator, regulator for asnA, asnC and gidA
MYSLDSVDRQIIRTLQRDGRASNVEIARVAGVSEATVRKRLERLMSEGVVRISAEPDATKVGLSTVTFLSFEIELSQMDQIADRLSRCPEVRSIYYTTGENDLIAEAWFPSSNELLHFLTHQVASIPGIKRTATSHVLRTIKESSGWTLPAASPARILVVDDDPDFVEFIRLALSAAGFEVSTANRGEDAIALMRVSRPDLVIMDVMMRGALDGVQTVREMRTDGDLRTVPVLMVSSITDSALAGLLPRESSLPVDNFLAKPIEMSLLVSEVRRLLRSRSS